MIKSNKINFEQKFPEISKDWNAEKNNYKSPSEFSPKSGFVAWWKCKKNHEWKTRIADRTYYKTGCPYCSGKKAHKKHNLLIKYPEISKEWDLKKNLDLKPENVWAYEEISKRFKYDSSYITSLHSEKVFNQSLFNFKKNNLFEYFIFANPFFSNKIKLRSGGTFLKLFPTSLTINTMRKSHDNGYSSLLYLHPYEFLSDYEFWIPLKDFSKYYFPKNLIKYARQIQWHKIGNKSIEKKLKKITSTFEHQGPMGHFVVK